jgi:hypothetical protein
VQKNDLNSHDKAGICVLFQLDEDSSDSYEVRSYTISDNGVFQSFPHECLLQNSER